MFYSKKTNKMYLYTILYINLYAGIVKGPNILRLSLPSSMINTAWYKMSHVEWLILERFSAFAVFGFRGL